MQEPNKDLVEELKTTLKTYSDATLTTDARDRAGERYGALLTQAERLQTFDQEVAKTLLESDWGQAGSAFHTLCKKATSEQIQNFFAQLDESSKTLAFGRLFNYGTEGLVPQMKAILNEYKADKIVDWCENYLGAKPIKDAMSLSSNPEKLLEEAVSKNVGSLAQWVQASVTQDTKQIDVVMHFTDRKNKVGVFNCFNIGDLVEQLTEKLLKDQVKTTAFTEELSSWVKCVTGQDADATAKKMFDDYAKQLKAAKSYEGQSKVRVPIVKQLTNFFRSIMQTRHAKKALKSKEQVIAKLTSKRRER